MNRIRGIRGAITIEHNNPDQIRQATQTLLQEIMKRNSLGTEDVVSAIFTLTTDLNAAFPAASAREIGWDRVPMICLNEIPVPGALTRCIRVLLHVETALAQREIHHVYLGEAVNLRRDLVD